MKQGRTAILFLNNVSWREYYLSSLVFWTVVIIVMDVM